MNAHDLALKAYGAPGGPIRSARDTEHAAFSKITQRICKARDANPFNFAELAEALYDNQRLWTLVAMDVADEGNGLSAELRGRLFYLAQFSTNQTKLVLGQKGSVDSIIEVNTAIMRGLRPIRDAA
ncbi:flagellar biosynthesis regulator FlaF [Aestuariibius insulae]|uniref:flagellar biosynthesis regulator FlaF n=1 Tax=Aestuariibius insulae TaxID=2058287 RepID=UPI00345EEA7B